MDDYLCAQHIFPKIENQLAYEWPLHEHLDYDKILLENPPLHSLLEPNLPPFSEFDQLTKFQDFDDFCGGVFFDTSYSSSSTSFGDSSVDQKPRTNCVTGFDKSFENGVMGIREGIARSRGKRKKSGGLELREIQKHFNVPIKEAAKELGVGVTRLKRRCRELNIARWPHRKFKSLKHLIANVKKMGFDGEEVMMLEEHKKLLEEAPNSEFNAKTKKLRQACFKTNYKNKKSRMGSF